MLARIAQRAEGDHVRPVIVALVALGIVAVGPSASAAQTPKLFGTVGPSFTITLKDASGKRVTTLAVGKYTIVVSDRSASHNFHLRGPGVNRAITGVGFVGKKTVTVALKAGTYTYQCDPHSSSMRGKIRVVKAVRLLGSVGPEFTIGLTSTSGTAISSIKPGFYAIAVADKSAIHNFHLRGPGVNVAITGVAFVGTKTVTVQLRPGRYLYVCDPHSSNLKGSFTVTS
jgi:plastocyanin